MELTFQQDYWKYSILKEQFKQYLNRIFGLDLSEWDRRGFWDDNYRPFSYFNGNELVANVCVYSMDMTLMGRRSRVAQISAVGTIPEYRQQGLASRLMDKAMEWAEPRHEHFYLFADEGATGLYHKYGFRPVTEYKPRIEVAPMTAKPGLRKLNMNVEADLDFVYGMAKSRSPVSNHLGVCNDKLFIFWCLTALRDHVYYISDLAVLVLYKCDGGLAIVYDIVGHRVPPFGELWPYLSNEQVKRVEFCFMTDELGLQDEEYLPMDDNGTHIRGGFPLEHRPFMFPIVSQA